MSALTNRLREALDVLTSTSVEIPSCVLERGESCASETHNCECEMAYGDTICAECGGGGTFSVDDHAEGCRKRAAIQLVSDEIARLRAAAESNVGVDE